MNVPVFGEYYIAWVPVHGAVVDLQGKPGSSILVIEMGSGKANLGRKYFDISRSSVQGEKVK